jgi:hypothetical protein
VVKNTIDLNKELQTLNFKTGENNWCEVELQDDGKIYQIGAEDKTIIIEKLKVGLFEDNLEIIGELDGIPVAWVLSLAEKHSSIFVGIVGDNRHLFFQNEAGDTFAKITLSSEVCKNWLQSLNENS